MGLAWWLLGLACTVSFEPGSEDPSPDGADEDEAACRAGEAVACTRLAERYLEGGGVEADPQRAAELLAQGCGGGDAEGCARLAQLHETGEHLPRDLERAGQLYGAACKAGSAPSCATLARLHLDGMGVAKDPKQAVDLLQQACRAGRGESCSELASLFQLGAQVPRNLSRSRRWAQRGCRQEHPRSCAQLAELLILDDDDKAALEILEGLEAAEASGVPPLVLHGLRLAAGEKPEEVGPALVKAWKGSEPGQWSWSALAEHLEQRRRTRDLVVILELLDAPRSGSTEAALRAGLSL